MLAKDSRCYPLIEASEGWRLLKCNRLGNVMFYRNCSRYQWSLRLLSSHCKSIAVSRQKTTVGSLQSFYLLPETNRDFLQYSLPSFWYSSRMWHGPMMMHSSTVFCRDAAIDLQSGPCKRGDRRDLPQLQRHATLPNLFHFWWSAPSLISVIYGTWSEAAIRFNAGP